MKLQQLLWSKDNRKKSSIRIIPVITMVYDKKEMCIEVTCPFMHFFCSL